MNIEELFSGIGMVIDDQVFNMESSDKIIRIVENIESKGFPLVKYNEIPNVSGANIAKFSFVLLDWELVSVSDEDGNPIPLASLKLYKFNIVMSIAKTIPFIVLMVKSGQMKLHVRWRTHKNHEPKQTVLPKTPALRRTS